MRLGAADGGSGKANACGLQEIEDARRSAECWISSPHRGFRGRVGHHVVRPFIEEYMKRENPKTLLAAIAISNSGCSSTGQRPWGSIPSPPVTRRKDRKESGEVYPQALPGSEKRSDVLPPCDQTEILDRIRFTPVRSHERERLQQSPGETDSPFRTSRKVQDILFHTRGRIRCVLRNAVDRGVPRRVVDGRGMSWAKHKGLPFTTKAKGPSSVGLTANTLYVRPCDCKQETRRHRRKADLMAAGPRGRPCKSSVDHLPERCVAKIRYAIRGPLQSDSRWEAASVVFDNPRRLSRRSICSAL